MLRTMQEFHQDAEQHWVVRLSCGHAQHVRHQPPFTLRPWVSSVEGRAGRVGQRLECPLCDRREIPPGHVAYKRTAVFQRETIPSGLLKRHNTKVGVWAILHVTRGSLEFFETPAEGAGETRLVARAGEPVVIMPEVPHRVAANDDVEFAVEFWRAPAVDS